MTDLDPATAARLKRIDTYGTWLADDVDGLIFNLIEMPPAMPQGGTSVILTAARDRLRSALARIEQAVMDNQSRETA